MRIMCSKSFVLWVLTFFLAQVPSYARAEQVQMTEFTEFEGVISGNEVVPKPENPSNASGNALIGFDPNMERIDAEVELHGIAVEDVRKIEVFQGQKGQKGHLIVTLFDHKEDVDCECLEPDEEDPSTVVFTKFNKILLPADSTNDLRASDLFLQVTTKPFPNGELRGQLEKVEESSDRGFDLRGAPGPLADIPVPEPPNLDDFVKHRELAILLGKAFFWEMQTGSDGVQACGSCHFHAGVDVRTRNSLGLPRSGDDPPNDPIRGVNVALTVDDFPLTKVKDEERNFPEAPEDFERITSEIFGSQGVVQNKFAGLHGVVDPAVADDPPIHPVHHLRIGDNRRNIRKVEPRQAAQVINAVFNDRNFWDGRANRFFNGVNPFGELDPDARVWRYDEGKKETKRVKILLDNSSLASQAVGPPLSNFEMSWTGRTFPDVGRKLLNLPPLALQKVHPDDSVLHIAAKPNGNGLKSNFTYPGLIKAAFHKKWWGSPNQVKIDDQSFSQMEANFALFWGLAIQLYEATLVSDDTPFDRWAQAVREGEPQQNGILSLQQLEGMELFLKQGMCIECHVGPEFTQASVNNLRFGDEGFIEFMNMEQVSNAFYDNGFYNIGVTPTLEDIGLGADANGLGPIARTLRVQQGLPVELNGQDIKIRKNDPTAVFGSFKVAGLRNVELSGPFFHNGYASDLREVIVFYAIGGFHRNPDNKDPDVDGIGKVRGNENRIQAMVAFLKSLTDERVRFEKAPFDHPSIEVVNGHFSGASNRKVEISAVGRKGNKDPLLSFQGILEAGGFVKVGR